MQYSTYVDARLGATVAVNLAPRFRAFLITYLGALVNNCSAPAPLVAVVIRLHAVLVQVARLLVVNHFDDLSHVVHNNVDNARPVNDRPHSLAVHLGVGGAGGQQ